MEEMKKPSPYIEFVKGELAVIGEAADDEKLFEELKECVVDLCKAYEMLCDYNVGGKKSKAVLKLFAKLAAWMPLTSLLGTDDEWELVADHNEIEDDDILYQNKRCPRVYKRRNGECFDSEAKILSYDGFVWFRSKESNKTITEWPYIPPLSPERVLLKKEDQPKRS